MKNMKLLTLFAIVLFSALVFTGCGNGAESKLDLPEDIVRVTFYDNTDMSFDFDEGESAEILSILRDFSYYKTEDAPTGVTGWSSYLALTADDGTVINVGRVEDTVLRLDKIHYHSHDAHGLTEFFEDIDAEARLQASEP